MMVDPLIRWKGTFPYIALAQAGIHPHSTLQEVKDASFELMVQGKMTPDIRAAWDELRVKRRRLLVDFFLHHTDFAEQTDKYLEEAEEAIQRIARDHNTNPADDIQFDS